LRLDVLLVQRGLFESREKAKFAIENQTISVHQKLITKPSFDVAEDAVIDIGSVALPYVSIGGLKLAKAIHDFKLDFRQKRVLDIGASTGGFTDCALQFGANQVFAVDVGSGQLHPSLQAKVEVVSIEHQNLKTLTLSQLEDQKVDIAVMDVSFTSQIPLFPFLSNLLRPEGILVSLIKPQFEMDQHRRFRGGIVKDEKIQQHIIRRVKDAALEHHLVLQQICEAPSQEGKNKEFLAWFILKS
jgi:23S rRNA (cytidine1920-2'-O)/16S rRNA (cytidine1409-2'-O)-methyltransferase